MRPPAVVSALVVLVVTVCTATGCSGDDVFPRDQFVREVTKGGVDKSVAECTYDNIKSDKAIMADLVKADGPNDNISAKTDEKMSRVIARCLLSVDADTTTTTKKPSRTTTTAKKR
ncbi:MAG: hypothetical protein U0Q22_15920 [Acidimicrobiales bacterium]